MDNWTLLFTKQAVKDAKKAASAGLSQKINQLLDVVKENPYEAYPPYEKLTGDLQGYYSRRINVQHRLGFSARNPTMFPPKIGGLGGLQL